MKIEAKVTVLSNSTNNVKALASITIEDSFVVTGIRIVEGNNGYFTAMPSRKTNNGEYKDVCFPITSEFRQQMQDTILLVFKNKINENGNQPVNQNTMQETSFDNYVDDLPF